MFEGRRRRLVDLSDVPLAELEASFAFFCLAEVRALIARLFEDAPLELIPVVFEDGNVELS